MKTEPTIYINELKYKPQEFLFYMHQFVEAGRRAGFVAIKEHASPKHLFRRIMPVVLFFLNTLHLYRLRRHPLIITSRGSGILEAAYPHYFHYHIIPMLWDTWPKEQDWLFKDLRRLKCPLVMVTARQMAIRIEQELKIKSIWIPEGIDTQGFSKGGNLVTRPIDVYELGRQHAQYHKVVTAAIAKGCVNSWVGNTYGENGVLIKLACSTAEELKDTLAKSKIVVCFPKVDTDSIEVSGNIETLTQRYWEAMLSRSLPVGRAPRELTDLIGYNPVIDVDWDHPEKQLADILTNISAYQSLVDKNYDTALKMASWDGRMDKIKEFIAENLQA